MERVSETEDREGRAAMTREGVSQRAGGRRRG